MNQKPYLNLGCGRIILPGDRPAHHSLVNPAIYDYPLWVNADRNAQPGVDQIVDLFRYPWPWADNSFDGALLSHIAEHIPHDIQPETWTMNAWHEEKRNRWRDLMQAQDGWYAFFAELYRVLTPGAQVHILSPYGWSQGAITDPTHTRYLTEQTFTHSMQPDPNSPFAYETLGLNFRLTGPAGFRLTEMFQHMAPVPGDNEAQIARKHTLLNEALMTRINVVYELYVVLEAIKNEGQSRLQGTD